MMRLKALFGGFGLAVLCAVLVTLPAFAVNGGVGRRNVYPTLAEGVVGGTTEHVRAWRRAEIG